MVLNSPLDRTSANEKPSIELTCTTTVLGLDQELGEKFGRSLMDTIVYLSRHFDLSGLEKVTAAVDYNAALLDVDRGYESRHKLTPSDKDVFGVAMTPTVIRDGKIKSQIVLNPACCVELHDFESEMYSASLHVVAHECAHVEVNAAFDRCFPGTLLRSARNYVHGLQLDAMLTCWDEYAASCMSAPFGVSNANAYVEMLMKSLDHTRERANDKIKKYRIHADIEKVLKEVFEIYGNLMKFSGYFLGNMDGLGLTMGDFPEVQEALKDHWFEEYFERLSECLKAIARDFNQWRDFAAFDALIDIATDIVEDGGLFISDEEEDGRVNVDIPFTWQTIP